MHENDDDGYGAVLWVDSYCKDAHACDGQTGEDRYRTIMPGFGFGISKSAYITKYSQMCNLVKGIPYSHQILANSVNDIESSNITQNSN